MAYLIAYQWEILTESHWSSSSRLRRLRTYSLQSRCLGLHLKQAKTYVKLLFRSLGTCVHSYTVYF